MRILPLTKKQYSKAFLHLKPLAIIISSFIIILSSCDFIDPDENIPAYYKIDSIFVDYDTEYPEMHNITDVWVTVNGDRIGTFEVPAIFPVIGYGKTNTVIMPGIKVNGISATRDIYPFFDYYEFDTVLTPLKTYELKPHFKYKNSLNIWAEHFPGIAQRYKFESTSQSDTVIVVQPDTLIGEGNYVGNIYLTVERPKFQCVTNEDFYFPTNGSKIYAELDYMNTQEFEVGLFVYKTSQLIEAPLVIINPHPNSYNRIYVDLTQYVNNNANAIKFRFYIGAEKPDTITRSTISIDNVKIIYF